MLKVEQLNAEQTRMALQQLIQLLQDAVDNGASVNFLPPLSTEMAEGYWQRVIGELGSGMRILLVAYQDDQLAGSVQLEFARQPNAPHRAEVQKLLVHTRFRKQGIATTLLRIVEEVALAAGRNLLILDTLRGSDAERLYRKHGYLEVGIVPQYVIIADNTFADTVIFYRHL